MPAPLVPFNAASHMYVERFTRVAAAIVGASAVDVSPTQNAVQTYGYLRSILIWSQNSVAASSGATYGTSDGPFNIASQVSLTDPNGAEIYGGPTFSGYDAYAAEKYGAYYLVNDMQLSPLFSNSVTAPKVPWRIWLEMNANSGLGSLPNMDAQSPYKLKVVQNTTGTGSGLIYQTAPSTTYPTQNYDYYIEAWTVPEPVNRITGQPQAIAPLGLGAVGGLQNGATVQHWTKSSPAVTSGSAQTVGFTRKGNIFRNVVLVARNSGLRAAITGALPLFMTYSWDGAPIYAGIDPQYLQERFFKQAGGQAGSTNVALDTGVIVIPYANPSGVDTQAVAPDSFGWNRFVGTVQSSRIELSGTFQTMSVLDILTNDVNFVDLTGSPYSFGFAQQLQAPAQPQMRT